MSGVRFSNFYHHISLFYLSLSLDTFLVYRKDGRVLRLVNLTPEFQLLLNFSRFSDSWKQFFIIILLTKWVSSQVGVTMQKIKSPVLQSSALLSSNFIFLTLVDQCNQKVSRPCYVQQKNKLMSPEGIIFSRFIKRLL